MVFTVDWRQSGIPPVPNEEIVEGAAEHADVLIPFASVDPRAARRAERARAAIASRRPRLQVPPQPPGVLPQRPGAYPLYEVIEEAGLPALFHTGQSGIGAGVPGGGGSG